MAGGRWLPVMISQKTTDNIEEAFLRCSVMSSIVEDELDYVYSFLLMISVMFHIVEVISPWSEEEYTV